MTRVLFLFFDGVGLGEDDHGLNPLAVAEMPNLRRLLGGQRLLAETAPFHGEHASLVALDAQLGVEGTPQSATGQAALLTGKNVSAAIGRHYGPKPNEEVAAFLHHDTLFHRVVAAGGKAALLNAYPPAYFENIDSGRRLYSAIPLAVVSAGIALKTAEDLQQGKAMSADFTGAGWAAQPGFPPAAVLEEHAAGLKLAELSAAYDLAFFDYWASDYVGHKQAFDRGVELMQSFDGVLGGLLDGLSDRSDLIVLTSDHGNMEDLSVRGHTTRPVPGLLIGPEHVRRDLAQGLADLTDVYQLVLEVLLADEAVGD